MHGDDSHYLDRFIETMGRDALEEIQIKKFQMLLDRVLESNSFYRNKFEQAGLLTSRVSGNKKLYQANTDHPLFRDIHNLLIKHIGFDQIIKRVITKIGNVEKVYLVGSFARGIDSSVIDLLLVGDDINREYLARLTIKGEKMINRKIRYLLYSNDEFADIIDGYRKDEILLLWTENGAKAPE